MAAHLLRAPRSNLSVTLIDPSEKVARGLAYSTNNPLHLLNVRASNMSAFADDPEHFWRWLKNQGHSGGDQFCFAARAAYGRYLESLLQPYLDASRAPGPLAIIRDAAIAIEKARDGLAIRLASGAVATADVAILACGHEPNPDDDPLFVNPWIEPVASGAPPETTILILGTGLTMVDVALALREQGHAGPIVAVSRRGVLPQAHRRVDPRLISADERPSGAALAKFCHWLRRLARERQAEGGDWRSVVDGLRPHVQAVWNEMPATSRRRFLEHARPWWDSHRHRMAPAIAVKLRSLLKSGQLEVIAGKVTEIVTTDTGAAVSIRRRGDGGSVSLQVSRIVSCRGTTSDPRKRTNPLIAQLLAQGLARVDPLRIGLDVTADCAVVEAGGRVSDRLFAIGPMSQAAFWEITAIPDIRLQAAKLAQALDSAA